MSREYTAQMEVEQTRVRVREVVATVTTYPQLGVPPPRAAANLEPALSRLRHGG